MSLIENFVNWDKLFYLDLPPLPDNLRRTIVTLADRLPEDSGYVERMEKFYENQFPIVSHVFGGHPDCVLPPIIQEKINKIYGTYFDCSVLGVIGKLKNTRGQGVAMSPPHCDRHRYVAINLLLQAGGMDVPTCFYNESRMPLASDMTIPDYQRLEVLTLTKKMVMPENKWHAYNVQRYHSTENIESSRLILALQLTKNINIDDFVSSHCDIIVK